MKILQIVPTFVPSKFGGLVTVSFNISCSLVKQWHSVTVYTTDAEIGSDRLKITEYSTTFNGIDVRYFKNLNNYFAYKFRLFLPIGFCKTAKRELKKHDIIHIHDFRTILTVISSYYARKYNIPYIIQSHGSVLPFFEKQLLKQAFDVIWGNKILQNASKCIALTKTESDQYIKMGVPEDRIVIIPNGLDLSQFSNLPERGTFRSKYGFSDKEQIVLFLGRIHKIKGIDLLIDAFSQVSEELPHARLVIAGPDDGYLSTVWEQIQRLKLNRKPLITGPLYGRDKLEAYVDADVYVLPSIYEAFSNTILEAWACGTPVIVTDSCAISSIAQCAGLVVKRDPIDLAIAIKRLILDEKLRDQCCKNGKSLINYEFNLESVITKIEGCYRQVIQT
ncbi:MAG: glycosyltransferase [Methanomicrobiales archaeon]|nr:glycosyltransferase [Methanomicrobiales archaeon]